MTVSSEQKEEQWMFEYIQSQGVQLLYYRKILVPVLELQLEMEEVSEKEHDYMHSTLLRILGALEKIHGDEGEAGQEEHRTEQHQIATLAHFTGLAPTAIRKKMAELFALGLIKSKPENGFVLSEVGTRAVASGKAMKRVQRSLRYCAISEQLLPKQAYETVFKPVQKLTEADFKYVAIAHDKEYVNLHALDHIKNFDHSQKSALNIPDEVQSITQIHDYRGGYQFARLIIAKDGGRTLAWLQFQNSFLSYPLRGFPMPQKRLVKDVDRELRIISKKLADEGVKVSEIRELDHGVLFAHVSAASNAWLGKQTRSFTPNILRCSILGQHFSGSIDIHVLANALRAPRQAVGLPMFRFPLDSADKLQGRALYLDIRDLNDDIKRARHVLGRFYELKNQYYRVPFVERTVKKPMAFIQLYMNSDELDEVRVYAVQFNLKDPLKLIDSVSAETD